MANHNERSPEIDSYDPQRVVASLRELAARTGGPDGSRRLCWTPEWLEARALLRESVTGLPVDVDTDEAGNLWVYLRGERADTVVVGSHLDSVPKGGWLDGALGVMAGLELLRSLAAQGTAGGQPARRAARAACISASTLAAPGSCCTRPQ